VPRFIKMWLFSAAVSLMALGMWKGIEWYYTKDLEELPPIEISALDLAKAYENDPSLARVNYNGEKVIITGLVTDIRQSGNQYTVILDGNFYDIELGFSDLDEINKLGSIIDGDTITIIGEVSGVIIVTIQVIDCYFE
jgi:hypothetical protein